MAKRKHPRRVVRLAVRCLEYLHTHLTADVEVTLIIRHGRDELHLGTGCKGCEPHKLRRAAAVIDQEILESN